MNKSFSAPSLSLESTAATVELNTVDPSPSVSSTTTVAITVTETGCQTDPLPDFEAERNFWRNRFMEVNSATSAILRNLAKFRAYLAQASIGIESASPRTAVITVTKFFDNVYQSLRSDIYDATLNYYLYNKL